MAQYGPNLGEPHTRPMGNGRYKMRLKGAEGTGNRPSSIEGGSRWQRIRNCASVRWPLPRCAPNTNG
ncbi:hypothetical protein [Burkholderia seminalis]|uniref:hypothetical protein n=2 Tax=Burkholderia seminalis TaxID=488731 RepID=UPI0031D22D6E